MSPSGILADQMLQVGAVAAAAGQLLAAVQHHDIFSTIDGYQFLDAPDVHDHRAVYADEVSGVQALGHPGNGFPKEVGILPCIETNVVGCGLDPVNLVKVQEDYPAVRSDRQALVELGSWSLLGLY